MKRIIPLYLIREMLPTFFLTILVFTFILLMAKVLELTELVVVKGIQPMTILNLLALSLPYFMSLTIPMATLLAVLLAFLRLSGDNEIVVLRAAGVGLYQLLPSVLLFCLWTYLLTSYFTLVLVPAADGSFRNKLLELAKARADVAIKERVFNKAFDNMVLFVNHIPIGSEMMEDLFIRDEREEDVTNVIVASQGRIATDKEQRALILQLLDGVIDRINRELKVTDTISFERYEVRLYLWGNRDKEGMIKRDQYEMPTDELWRITDELEEEGDPLYPAYLLEAHRRFSLPFACLVLGLVGVPLGVRFKGKGRNWGISIGMGLFLVYYLLLSMARSFGHTIYYPPLVGVWMPNVVIGAVAVYLWRMANREGTTRFLSFLDFDWVRLPRFLKKS